MIFNNKIILFGLLLGIRCISAQIKHTDTLRLRERKTQITALFHDSLSSSFHIIIPEEVRLHKHLHHTEQVIILKGEAKMKVGEQEFSVRPGDVILIPRNTPHALKVKGNVPLECISVQSPYFDGSDRVLLEK